MKIKCLFLALAIAVSSSTALANDVPEEHASLTSQIIDRTSDFVERTVNIIRTSFLSKKDVECLAYNIFYESASEPLEGKFAVGIVTMNRVQDSRFGSSVCEVVKAKTVFVKQREVQHTETVKVGFFGRNETITKTKTITERVPVCQFSWWCMWPNRKPRVSDERWIESQQVAEAIAQGDYEEYRDKYSNALYFHAASVRPVWAKTKRKIARVGQHIFYE